MPPLLRRGPPGNLRARHGETGCKLGRRPEPEAGPPSPGHGQGAPLSLGLLLIAYDEDPSGEKMDVGP